MEVRRVREPMGEVDCEEEIVVEEEEPMVVLLEKEEGVRERFDIWEEEGVAGGVEVLVVVEWELGVEATEEWVDCRDWRLP